MTDSVSMNPFQPGAGLLPGYMGHRPAIEQPLLEIVDRLRAGQNDRRSSWSPLDLCPDVRDTAH